MSEEPRLPPALPCPRCNAAVVRTRRRFIDRLGSLLVRQYRYRCTSFTCTWEGNLKIKDIKARAAASHKSV